MHYELCCFSVAISAGTNTTRVVLHLRINTTYRQNVVDKDASMNYINVEWCASAGFADKATIIMPYPLPIDLDQERKDFDHVV